MRNLLDRLSTRLGRVHPTTWGLVVVAVVLIFLTALPAAEAPFAHPDRVYRQALAAYAAQREPSHVAVILIDRHTVQTIGVQQCFAQSSHAQMLAHLHEAASVVVDMTMMCSESDTPALVASIKAQGRVVLPVHVYPDSERPDVALFPVPALMAAAAAVGQRTLVVGSDHLVQGILPYAQAPQTGDPLTHLTLQAIRVAGMTLPFGPLQDLVQNRVSGLGDINTGVLPVLLPARFDLPWYSYADVLQGRVPDSTWQGRIVYIGDGVSDRAGRYNLSSEPEARLSGTEANAMVTEALLDGHILRALPTWILWAIHAVAIVGTLLICVRLSGWLMACAMVAWLALLLVAEGVLLLQAAYWLAPGAVVAACCVMVALAGWRRAGSLRGALLDEYARWRRHDRVGVRAGHMPSVVHAQDVGQVMAQIRGWQSEYLETLDALPYAVFIEEAGRVIRRNGGARTLVAHLRSEAMSRAQTRVLLRQIRDLTDQAKAQGSIHSLEVVLARRVHRLIVTPFASGDQYGSGASMICVVDVHDIRAAADKDRATLRHMAHDMRSPLATVLSLLEDRLQAGGASNATAGHADDEVLADMHKLVDYSLRVAEDFTQLSRAGHIDPARFVPVPINDLVMDAVDQLWRPAQAQNIDIGTSLWSSEIHVSGQRDMLLRALVNLLDNAVKYSPRDSAITVRVQRDASAREVVVSIRDQGLGIDEASQSQLFEPFFQVGGAAPAASRGVGLGLAFVRSVARAHGGDVRVESRLGAGSCFSLHLPCLDEDQGEHP